MKGQGGIRRFIAAAGRVLSRLKFWGRTHKYAIPVLRDPYAHRRSGRRPGKYRARKPLPCKPGTIVYHDKLVKHFGRRKAEGYRIAIQLGHMSCLPTKEDFANNPPWAFLSTGTG